MVEIKDLIFRGYDIRGVYPTEIDEDLAYRLGRAFVTFFKCKQVVIGKDMRKSSPSLFKALAKGATDQGADVIDIGMCTTPMLSFSVANYDYEGGIMISASHNPPEYNAFKLIKKKALQVVKGSGMEEIKELIKENKFEEPAKKGKITKKEVLNDYISHISKFTENIKDLKIAVDYGNGVGAISAKPLFSKLPITVLSLYEKPDGTFPNHHANPHDTENFKDLQRKVIEEKADLGIFFDGDADRSIMVDENGEIVSTDMLVGVIVGKELKKYPGEKVYHDLRFSKAVREEIKKAGGKPVMMKVGNPFYKEKLINEGGLMGAEVSGHVMFKENYNIDDGLFLAIKTMDIMCTSEKKISELIKPLKKYFQTEEINIEVKNQDKVLDIVKERFKDGKFIDIDGVLIEYPDWWFNLRKSNTEPLIRLRAEADTKEKLDEKKQLLLKIMQEADK